MQIASKLCPWIYQSASNQEKIVRIHVNSWLFTAIGWVLALFLTELEIIENVLKWFSLAQAAK